MTDRPRTDREIDAHVGDRLRRARWRKGWTQTQLADAIGTRFQQVQKYEKGANRVAASRLWRASQALGVPPGWFFHGLGKEPQAVPEGRLGAVLAAQADRLPEGQRQAVAALMGALVDALERRGG